jgi:hypothetical protein
VLLPHRFYQHVPDSSEWQWGLVWGHAKSQDLVNWEHLPVALQPTPNSLDQHGCFSGCATVDVDGRPTILYTGVSKRDVCCAPGAHEPPALRLAQASCLHDAKLIVYGRCCLRHCAASWLPLGVQWLAAS